MYQLHYVTIILCICKYILHIVSLFLMFVSEHLQVARQSLTRNWKLEHLLFFRNLTLMNFERVGEIWGFQFLCWKALPSVAFERFKASKRCIEKPAKKRRHFFEMPTMFFVPRTHLLYIFVWRKKLEISGLVWLHGCFMYHFGQVCPIHGVFSYPVCFVRFMPF